MRGGLTELWIIECSRLGPPPTLDVNLSMHDKIILMENKKNGLAKRWWIGFGVLLILLPILFFANKSFNAPPQLTPVVTLQKSPTVLSAERTVGLF